MILQSCSGMSVGTNGALNGFVPSPNDAWHQDVSAAAVDPNSTTIMTNPNDLGGVALHPDFGSIAGGNYGIPYNVVDSSQTANVAVPINLYGSESDLTVAPIPSNAVVEGSPAACASDGNDRHLIVLDRKKCVAYEYWQASTCNSAWSASTNAVFDFSETEQRPYAFTSADAAGLSIFEGLVRYDEIIAGSINHAIRFTAKYTKDNANDGYFVAPATHAAGNLWGTDNIIGMRIRLRADFDISQYSTTNQIILKAMKQYGMILADNGGKLFFQGTADARWDDGDLNNLKAVPATAFEVVKMSTMYDETTAPTGVAPTITSFTASATTVAPGTPVVLTAVTSNASYSFVDKAGFVRDGVVTVAPTATTTYMLTSRNAFGTNTATLTVTVKAVTIPAAIPASSSLALNFTSYPWAVNSWMPGTTSNSYGAVTTKIVSGPAYMSWGIVHVTGTGAVVVQSTQAAYGKFAATTVNAVVPGTDVPAILSAPALTLSLEATPWRGIYTVATNSNSYGPISVQVLSGPGSISWGMLRVLGSGPVVVQVQQGAYGKYSTATIKQVAPAGVY